MPAPHNNPYQQAQKLASNPRETESRALLESARRMKAVQRTDADREEYRNALRLNWRLWTLFQTDVAEDSNPLPVEIKRNILSLCAFIDRHTVSALPRVAPDRLQILIDINRQIALGLSNSTEDTATAGATDSGRPVPSTPPDTSGPPPSTLATGNWFVA